MLFLRLIKHQIMKTYGEVETQKQAFSVADCGEWSVSRFSHFTPRELTPGIQCSGGSVRCSELAGEARQLCPFRKSNYNTRAVRGVV
jgi:hypothetical protein